MNIVEVDRLSRRYGEVAALDDVTLQLDEGRIHGLLGRNGAGKTTLMQILTAQRFASSGTVRVFGEDPYENAAVLSRIAFVREAQKYPDLYRVTHVMAAGRLAFPLWDDDLARDLVDAFALRPRQRIRKLSRGQLSAVGVILGLASRAPLTIFDEPYLGLDAVARQLFYDRLLQDYAEFPRTVVLSTHLIDEVSNLVEHVVVLEAGRVIIDAETDDLRTTAATVTGPTEAVEAYAAGHQVLHRERLGSVTRATVRDAGGGLRQPAPGSPVTLEPVSLQQLVVRATQAEAAVTADRGDPDPSLRTGKVLQP